MSRHLLLLAVAVSTGSCLTACATSQEVAAYGQVESVFVKAATHAGYDYVPDGAVFANDIKQAISLLVKQGYRTISVVPVTRGVPINIDGGCSFTQGVILVAVKLA